jgi:hypothetical protein
MQSEPPHRIAAPPGGRHSVPYQRIAEQLALSGWLWELREGQAGQVEKDVAAALSTLSQAGLSESPSKLFDPGETINRVIAAGLGEESDIWRSRFVATGQRLVSHLCNSATSKGMPRVESLPDQRFEVIFARTFNLGAFRPGAQPRLRLPLPVEDHSLRDLTVETDGSGGRIRPGRIEFTPAGKGGEARISARFSFTAASVRPEPGACGDADQLLWLAEKEGPIQVTDKVRELAMNLAGGQCDPLDVVRRFREHLIDAFACGVVDYGRIGAAAPPDWVIDNRWYDCRLGAALLASLCRARGIPARLIGGYLLWDAPTEHYWMEAWIDELGWTPFDLLAWDLSAGGRDAAWRNIYSGKLDYRMKTQIFPHLFTGSSGLPQLGGWHRVAGAIENGAETRFVAADSGMMLFCDAIRVFKA